MSTNTLQLPKTIQNTLPVKEPAAGPRKVLLNRYEVLGRLGSGAMGEVLKVKDLQSGLEYALKRVPFFCVSEPDTVKRIQENFALVSRLTHPHIATTRFFEFDPESSEAYQIMDLVNGTTLTKWMEAKRREQGGSDKPIPLDLAAGIAGQLASALDYAHQQPTGSGSGKLGVLHRDLKPDNIMVEAGREFAPGIPYVRIIDFGLAAEAQTAINGHSLTTPHNECGGTLFYMAPEQWDGRALTSGVDQWALGVIVYEMLAGRKPFSAGDRYALYQVVRKADPARVGHLPAWAWNSLRKALNHDRRKRHASCTALVQGLRPPEVTFEFRSKDQMTWWQWLLIPVQIAIFIVALGLAAEGATWLKGKLDRWINGEPSTPTYLYPTRPLYDPTLLSPREPFTSGSKAVELLKNLDKEKEKKTEAGDTPVVPNAQKTPTVDPYFFKPTPKTPPAVKPLSERLREILRKDAERQGKTPETEPTPAPAPESVPGSVQPQRKAEVERQAERG